MGGGVGILDRFILKELSGAFFFGVASFTMVFVAGDLLFQAANLIIEQGVSLGVVARLLIYRLPEVVILTLPMDSLLSSLLTFSRLSANSELVALKSAGIPFHRILRPVFLAAVLVGLAAMIGAETLVPFANRAAENLLKYEVLHERPALLKEKVTAEKVKEHFKGIVKGEVVRYELPNIHALNFVMYAALGGGVTRSLSVDMHGKGLSSYLLDMDI